MLDNGVEQGKYVISRLAEILAHPALLGRAVQCGEIELFLCGVEAEHEVEHHFLHLLGAAVGLVHLVYHHHGLKTHLDSLLQHKTCLWHRAFKCVDQQQAAVGHIEHSLHLAAEVGVSRGVDYVYLVSLVFYRYVFGENRYASFALEVVVVEYKFSGILVLAEKMACKEHLVHKRGFAVVYVRYDSYVTYFLHISSLLQGAKLLISVRTTAIKHK